MLVDHPSVKQDLERMVRAPLSTREICNYSEQLSGTLGPLVETALAASLEAQLKEFVGLIK